MKKNNKKDFIAYIFIPAIALVVLGTYAIICLMTFNKTTYNTYINGIDVSTMNRVEVYDRISSGTNGDYNLVLKVRGFDDFVIPGDKVDYELNIKADIEEIIMDHGVLTAPLDLFGIREYEIELKGTFDEEKLDKLLDTAEFLRKPAMEDSVDAHISSEPNNGKFEIIPEVYGTKLDKERVKDIIVSGLKEYETELTLEDFEVYEDPKILSTDEELNTRLEELNNVINIDITVLAQDKTYEFNGDYIFKYIVDGKNGTELNQECVDDFVKMLNKELTTLGNGITFTNSNGETKEIPGGNWGWWLDTSKLKEEILEIMESGKSGVIEAPWKQEAPLYGETEFKNYIEIDMTRQHLYIYTDNELVGDYPIVTGTYTSSGRRTPEGIYILNYKTRNATLRGPGYASPVKYWMPFNGGIGMHDANWRSKFGGNIYKYDGSHGCINMPTDGAKQVYDIIDKTYAIICFY